MKRDKPFFVGYLAIPTGLRLFLFAVGIGLIGFFAAASLLTGATQNNPGDGAFRNDYGRQTVTGVLELRPYPLLRVTEGSKRVPAGHTIMLVAGGKRGLMERAAELDDKLVTASGILLARGDLDMMQVRGGKRGLAAADGETPELRASEPLGRWRLAGEICDGKCLAGAMRPGRGLAHKACANLCLIGDIPPVLALTGPVEGQMFMLIGGPDGGPMPPEMLHQTSVLVEMEGRVMRRGDLLIFHADPATLKVL